MADPVQSITLELVSGRMMEIKSCFDCPLAVEEDPFPIACSLRRGARFGDDCPLVTLRIGVQRYRNAKAGADG